MAKANNSGQRFATQNRGTTLRPAIEFLFGRLNYERTPTVPYQEQHFKLDRMVELADRLGNPHQRLKIVHVAGSKGKGSTATMIASIFREHGQSVGLYTSPHVHFPEERISIDLEPCSSLEFDKLIELMRPHVLTMDEAIADDLTQRGPTYFEMLTAAGLLHFERNNVAFAVMEVGLGGRLDSTNICDPVCSVVTTISKDHTLQLGNTLAEIASEKAGIIKPRRPVVCGVLSTAAQTVIHQVAEANDSPLFQLGRDFSVARNLTTEDHSGTVPAVEFSYADSLDYGTNDESDETYCLEGLRTGMLGEHQMRNAAVAIKTVQVAANAVGLDLSPASIGGGIAAAKCLARVEVVNQQPLIVVDAAHNEASARALVATLKETWPKHSLTFVLAATRGKDVRAILDQILPAARRLILTRYLDNPRCCDPAVLQEEAMKWFDRSQIEPCPVDVEPSPESALAKAIRFDSGAMDGPPHLICVTGSFFLAAELRVMAANPNADSIRK